MAELILKPAKTYAEQRMIPERRGLTIDDPSYAEQVLSELNYYRLRGYYVHLMNNDDTFKSGITFRHIVTRTGIR